MICIGCVQKIGGSPKPALNLQVRPMTDDEIIQMEVISLSIVTGYRPIGIGLTHPTHHLQVGISPDLLGRPTPIATLAC